jgi:hypothetical protein
MALSYTEVWNETVRILRANAALFTAVAGAFLFLPALIMGYALPPPARVTAETLSAYYERNLVWFILELTISFIGTLALLVLALDESRPTVGGALRTALSLVGRYFTVSMLTFLMLIAAFIPASLWLGAMVSSQQLGAGFLGALVLMLPGFYALARLMLSGPIVVAERSLRAFAVLKRSLALTRGKGWQIMGLLLLVAVPFAIATLAATAVFGTLFLLLDTAAGGEGVGAFLLLVLTTAIATLFNLVLYVLLAALYRALYSPAPSPAQAPPAGTDGTSGT